MSIIKTDAFVLKSIKYGETSKIVTLFSKDFGKIQAIAKGARNSKSKLCGVLEAMNYINAVIYFKENRELQLISTADHIKSFARIHENLDKLKPAYEIIEFLNKGLPLSEKNISVFDLLLNVIQNLNESEDNFNLLKLYFIVNLITLLGIAPEFVENKYENDKNETFFENSEFYLSKEKMAIINFVKTGEAAGMSELKFDNNEIDHLNDLTARYFSIHTHGGKFLKSTKIFSLLKRDL